MTLAAAMAGKRVLAFLVPGLAFPGVLAYLES